MSIYINADTPAKKILELHAKLAIKASRQTAKLMFQRQLKHLEEDKVIFILKD